jgi:hypothetical protein
MGAAQAGGQAAPQFHDDHCGPPERFWLGGGPVLLWIKNGPLPVLATSSAGQVLGGDVSYGTFLGGQIDGGAWLDRRHTFGVGLSGFMTEQRSVSGSLFSDAAGSPLISRPAFDILTGVPINILAAAPGAFAGGVVFATSSRLAGAEAGLVHNLRYCQDYSIDVGFGFRYLDLDENLVITQMTQALANGQLSLAGTPVAGAVIEDRFDTRNQFYAGQFSARAEYRFGPVFLDVISKVALGPNHEVVSISGVTRDLAGTQAVSGGLLAVGQATTQVGPFPQPPGGNIGRDSTNRFAVLSEVGGLIGCQVTQHVRVAAGYHFLYINDVVRPGSQIDQAVNLRLVPLSGSFGSVSGPASPVPTARHDDFFAHGVQFRLEVVY